MSAYDGEAADALAPGTTWKSFGVAIVEGQTLAGFGASSDSNGDTHQWAWSAPFAWDWGYTNASFTVS